MSTTASHDDGFEVVVGPDGSIAADELARHGIRPGAYLRLLPADQSGFKRISAFGYLATTIAPEAADALAVGLAAGKADRFDALELS